MRREEQSGTLCILAHQDDEVAMASRIAREAQARRSVYCAFLTDGSGNRSDPEVRNAESRTVLARLGVPPENVFFIGTEERFRDGALFRELDRALAGVERVTNELSLDEILCLAWEGGHPDHDASHLIALAVARRRNLLDKTWQFPIYNGRNTPHFFRVMSPIENDEVEIRRLSFREGLRFGALGLAYPSQRRSWLGLLPWTLFKLAIRRREVAKRATVEAVRRRPHEGTLLYERRYSVSYAEFRRFADDFIAKNL
jgi:LmbE family N-acetylglucosaminyl deacetylase